MADDRRVAITAWTKEWYDHARVVAKYASLKALLADPQAVPSPLPAAELAQRQLQFGIV